jgi:antitoxin CptB
MTPELDPRRKRLLFRSLHRGTKETDLLIGGFAERYVADLDSAQLDRFEALLEVPDPELFDWVTARRPPPPEHDCDVLRLMITFNATR